MNQEQILQQVKGCLNEKGFNEDAETLELETRISDTSMDSLDQVEFIMEVEKAFSITIPDETAEGFDTFQDLVNFVEQQLQGR